MKRSRLRPVWCALALCAVLLTLFSGCGRKKPRDIILEEPDASRRRKVLLTFFGFKADALNLTAIESALQDYMSSHSDVVVTYEGIKGTEYWDAFSKRSASGTLDDVFMVHHDHLISLCAQGALADLSDLPGLEGYTDAVRAQFTGKDGSVYFLPTQLSTYNLYINYDLLAAHGQSVPTSWAELQQVCDYFVSQGIVPIIANNRNSLPTLAISKGLFDLYQQPEYLVVNTLRQFEHSPILLSAALAPGVEQVADMLARGWFDPAEVLSTEQTSDDLSLFAAGDRPFMVTGGWASARVAAMEPAFTYGVHPYPILNDGSVLSLQVDTCISVNAGSRHLQQARDFASYLIRPDVMQAYCDTQSSCSPLKDSRPPTEPTMAPSIPYLTNGRAVFRSEYRMDLPVETAMHSALKVLLDGGAVEQALDTLTQELQS